MEDNRKHNSGVIGNKGGGGWTAINREMWQNLKNEVIRQAYEILTNPDVSEDRKDKFRLKMLDKINDIGDVAGKLELIISEHGNETKEL